MVHATGVGGFAMYLNQCLSAELSYRTALQVLPSHLRSLERLVGIYLRYKETVAAAIQYCYKALEACQFPCHAARHYSVCEFMSCAAIDSQRQNVTKPGTYLAADMLHGMI